MRALRSSKLGRGWLALALLVSLASPVATQAAQAQEAQAPSYRPPRSRGLRPPQIEVSEKAHARAKQITAEAQAHYDAGRFQEAAEAYRRAYAVVPAPELLFNLGQCQRLLGRPQRSVKYFQAYLRLRPDAPHRALVEQLIEEGQLITPTPERETDVAAPPAVSARSTEPASPPASPEAPPHRRPLADIAVMPLPPPAPLPETGPRLAVDDRYADVESDAIYERWWFWTAIAVVAAGAAITTYALLEADSAPPDRATLGTIAWE